MIDLYYWPTPNGWKITIMLEEAELDYTVKPVNIGAGEQFEPEFLKISPNNRMPAIVDHNGPGGEISVFESGAILEYLAEKSGRFMPQDTAGKYEVLQWLYWQMGGLGPMLGQLSHFTTYAPQVAEDTDHSYALERYTNEGERLMSVMDRRLTDRDFLAGDYSVSDMACWPWIKPYERFGYDLGKWKNLKAWFDRIADRAAVQRAVAIGKDWGGDTSSLSEEAKKALFGKRGD